MGPGHKSDVCWGGTLGRAVTDCLLFSDSDRSAREMKEKTGDCSSTMQSGLSRVPQSVWVMGVQKMQGWFSDVIPAAGLSHTLHHHDSCPSWGLPYH